MGRKKSASSTEAAIACASRSAWRFLLTPTAFRDSVTTVNFKAGRAQASRPAIYEVAYGTAFATDRVEVAGDPLRVLPQNQWRAMQVRRWVLGLTAAWGCIGGGVLAFAYRGRHPWFETYGYTKPLLAAAGLALLGTLALLSALLLPSAARTRARVKWPFIATTLGLLLVWGIYVGGRPTASQARTASARGEFDRAQLTAQALCDLKLNRALGEQILDEIHLHRINLAQSGKDFAEQLRNPWYLPAYQAKAEAQAPTRIASFLNSPTSTADDLKPLAEALGGAAPELRAALEDRAHLLSIQRVTQPDEMGKQLQLPWHDRQVRETAIGYLRAFCEAERRALAANGNPDRLDAFADAVQGELPDVSKGLHSEAQWYRTEKCITESGIDCIGPAVEKLVSLGAPEERIKDARARADGFLLNDLRSLWSEYQSSRELERRITTLEKALRVTQAYARAIGRSPTPSPATVEKALAATKKAVERQAHRERQAVERKAQRERLLAAANSGEDSSSSAFYRSRGKSSGGTVAVRSYYRSNGTYVRSHSRGGRRR